MQEPDINKERLALALEAAGLDLWENDLVSGEVTCKVHKIFSELGYDAHEAVACVDEIFKIIHPDGVPILKQAVDDHLTGKTATYRCEFRIRAKNGSWVWYANYGKVMDRDGQNLGRRFIGVTFNIDDRKRKEDELININRRLSEQNVLLEKMNFMLQSLATSDPLTGIANRRQIMDTGEIEVQRAVRLRHHLALLMVDIDLFKQINDTQGHPVGDQVICAVAEACVQCVRGSVDTVGRIGGEEFALILPEADIDTARGMAERLRQAIAERSVTLEDGTPLYFTVSVGFAALSPEHFSFKGLLIDADKALYCAKASGRNCVQGVPVGAAEQPDNCPNA